MIQAGYSAMHSDGFTLNFSRVAGPMQIVSLALHRVNSKLGTFFAPMSAARRPRPSPAPASNPNWS